MSDRPIDRWTRLRMESGGEGLLDVPSISSGIETGYGPARFAVGHCGEPRLLIPFSAGGSSLRSRSTSNLAVTISRLSVEGRSVNFFDIMSLNRQLDPAFAELADEILHRLASGASPGNAVDTTIRDFRDLLVDPQGQEIAASQIIGLIHMRPALCGPIAALLHRDDV